jgi:hypothetical protein
VIKALCYKPEGSGFETRRGEYLSIHVILPAALTGMSTDIEITMFWVSRARPVRKDDDLTAVSRLSR